MYKRLVAIILSVIMMLSCSSVAFAEDSKNYKIIYTQEFMDSVDEYVDHIGAWFMKDDFNYENILPDGKVVLYYKGLKIYKEEADRVIFGLSDGWCTVTEEVVGDYVFANPSFFGYNIKENKTGLCVYEKGEIYSIREAVEKGMITADVLAEIIPFTVKASETTAPPTISTQSTTATMPSTNETEPTEVTPLPTVVTDPTEKSTDGQWAIKAPFVPDFEVNKSEYTENVPSNSTVEPTEEILTSVEKTPPLPQCYFKVECKTKKVKKSKVDKSDKVIKKAIVVKGYNGKVIYKKIAKASSKFLEINRKTGAVTVKKGISKGIHKIKFKVKTKEKVGLNPIKGVLKVKIK